MKPRPVTMYNHNGPVLVDAFNVSARLKTGWTMEPQGKVDPVPDSSGLLAASGLDELANIEPIATPQPSIFDAPRPRRGRPPKVKE